MTDLLPSQERERKIQEAKLERFQRNEQARQQRLHDREALFSHRQQKVKPLYKREEERERKMREVPSPPARPTPSHQHPPPPLQPTASATVHRRRASRRGRR